MPVAGTSADARSSAHAKWAARYAKVGNARKAIAHFGRALEYSGFGAEQDEAELRRLFRDGKAMTEAAQATAVYDLTLDGLRFRVAPSLMGGVTSVRVDALGEKPELLVTAVYGPRLETRAATRLDLPDEHYANVQRLIDARGVGAGAALFVRCDPDSAASLPAARSVLAKLHELGVASKSALVVIRAKGRVLLPTARENSPMDDYDRRRVFGSPMYEGSDVRVGTLGDLVNGNDSTPDAAVERGHVQTLFEGGEWALRQGSTGLSHVLEIEGKPDVTVQLQATTNVQLVTYVTVTTEFRGLPAGLGLRLFAVYDALRHVGEAAYEDGPATGLEAILRWGRDIDEAKKLVRENATDKMVIFAEPLDASEASKNIDAWRSVMRRVLRALHGMKLTAQQTSTDALVIVREGDGKLGAKRLLYLIRDSDPRSLMRREMGAVRPLGR